MDLTWWNGVFPGDSISFVTHTSQFEPTNSAGEPKGENWAISVRPFRTAESYAVALLVLLNCSRLLIAFPSRSDTG